MFLHQGTTSIEFTIDSYQYPEMKSSKEFDYDANWLICKIVYSDERCNETYKDACLLTDGLADFEKNMLHIVEG